MSNIATIGRSNELQMTEQETIKVLQSSLYPGAAIESIKMVLGYCKAAGLDPMQKPVHIVPMWDSKAGSMRDVVMPGVNLYRTQAMRSGECAGVTEPEFGPDIDEPIGGQKITYPAWCRVTVKRRLPTGEIVDFTAREFWRENYAVKGGKEKSIAPNAMWSKRPYGQIAKCAEAQALRKAFPEIASQPTADEMEGKAMRADDVIEPAFDYLDPTMFIDSVKDCKTDEEAAKYWKDHNGKFAKQPADHATFKDAVIAHRLKLKQALAQAAESTPATFEDVMTALASATDIDALYVAAGKAADITNPEECALLDAKFQELKTAMGAE